MNSGIWHRLVQTFIHTCRHWVCLFFQSASYGRFVKMPQISLIDAKSAGDSRRFLCRNEYSVLLYLQCHSTHTHTHRAHGQNGER